MTTLQCTNPTAKHAIPKWAGSTVGIITEPTDIRRFMLAGKAVLTLKSLRTGAHFTYRIDCPKDNPDGDRRFVSVLTGADNTGDYTYIGMIYGNEFRQTARSRVGRDAMSVKVIAWFCRTVLASGIKHPELRINHEGHCGRCARPLTTPESVERGIGPECWKKM